MLSKGEDALINAAIIGIVTILEASGLSQEEAKAQLTVRIAQLEALPDLPM